MSSITIQPTTTKKGRLARQVVAKLVQKGYVAYLAGGCVRDLLLGQEPKDYDIVTSARPAEIEELFLRTVPVGKKFGITTVIQEGYSFEVATFRAEKGFSDRRRPDRVFWAGAKRDALRRDLTINALFFDPLSNEVHDYTGGKEDLAAKIVRFVGNPNARVREDHLRVLRAVRFKNTLGFQYDPASYQAIRRHAREIGSISAERIRDEVDRMLAHPSRAQSLRELADLGLLQLILPEIDRLRGVPQPPQFHQEGDVFEHTVRALAALPKRVPSFLAWAVMFHDAGKAETLHYPETAGDRIRFEGHRSVGARLAHQAGRRLRLPKVEIETIMWLVEHHMNLKGIEKMREAKRRAYLLDPRFKWLLELHRADALGTVPANLSLYAEVKGFYLKYLTLSRQEQKIGLPKPLVTGHDLQKELGLEPGPKLGRILARLRDAQLERKIQTKSDAIAFAKQLVHPRGVH